MDSVFKFLAHTKLNNLNFLVSIHFAVLQISPLIETLY